MYVLAGTVEVVDRVLDGVDATCLGVFGDTYGIAQTPAEAKAIVSEAVTI